METEPDIMSVAILFDLCQSVQDFPVLRQFRKAIADLGMSEAREKGREYPKGADPVMMDKAEGGKQTCAILQADC